VRDPRRPGVIIAETVRGDVLRFLFGDAARGQANDVLHRRVGLVKGVVPIIILVQHRCHLHLIEVGVVGVRASAA
jgi:hypothetical protein